MLLIIIATSVSVWSYLLGLKLQVSWRMMHILHFFFYLEAYASGALTQSVLDGKRLVLTAAVVTPTYLKHFLYQRQQASVGFLLQPSQLWSLFVPASSQQRKIVVVVFFFFPDAVERLEVLAHRQVTVSRAVLCEGKLRCAGRHTTRTRAVQHLLK